MDEPCRILLISGSLRAGSTNSALLRTAQACSPSGVETTLYEGLGALPHFNPDDDPTVGGGESYGMPVGWVNVSASDRLT